MTTKIDAKALKSGVWYTASNFLVKSIGIITTPIFTRMLSHEEFGLFNNFTSWMLILSIIVTLNLDSTFISARYDFEKDFDRYILSVLTLSCLSALISGVLLNIFFEFYSEAFGLDRIYLNCLLVYLLFLPAVNLFQTRERYYFRYKVSVFLSLIVSVGTALLSVALVLLMQDRLEGRIIGSVVPTIIVGIILALIIIRNGKSVNIGYWKYALPICLPFVPHLLSLTVLNSVDRIMITTMCGADDNALYSLAYNCGALITILLTSMNTAFAPWLGQKLHEKNYKEINSFSKKYIALFLSLSFGIMLFAPDILLILGGRSYMGAIYVMPPVACGCIFQFLYTMFVNVEQFSRKTIGMAFASASAAVLNIILNIVFIPQFGYIAAAYTTLAGFLWLLIIHMMIVRHYGFKDVYSYKMIIISAASSLAVTVIINFIYQLPIVRYTIGGIYVVVIGYMVIKNRQLVINLFGKDKN